MNAGLPGAGIGGVFYMVSAIVRPFHAAHRTVRRRRDPRLADQPPVQWGPVFRQFLIAVGIIAALWLTGWGLGTALTAQPSALGEMESSVTGRTLPNVIKLGALFLSLGTLCVVLLAVQIGRLVVNRRGPSAATASMLLGAVVLLSASSSAAQTPEAELRSLAQSAQVEPPGALEIQLVIADSAYQAGDTALAAAAYARVLAHRPDNSRALFRLGYLGRRDPKRSLPLFRRYTSVVPDDPWGHIALGDALAVQGSLSEALREYDEAGRLAPAERDVALGRARVLARAGRIDDAIAVLEKWTTLHPDDAEGLRELGDQRRRAGRIGEAIVAYEASAQLDGNAGTVRRLQALRATHAPAVDLSANGGGDSDGNRAYRVGASINAPVADRARLTVSGGRNKSSGVLEALYYDGRVGLAMRPLSSLRVEGAAGAVHVTANTPIGNPNTAQPVVGNGRGSSPGTGSQAQPVVQTAAPNAKNLGIGFVRAVWKRPGTAALVDLRASRALLDATPTLVVNQVMRNEIAARVDLPVTRTVRLRGGARTATYSASGESNSRISLLGGIAASVTAATEVAAIFQQVAFDHATTSGYFAPRVAQLAELATYSELESESGRSLIIDAGVGGHRFTEFGQSGGKWKPVFRVMTQLLIPLRPGSELRTGFDTYNSQLAGDAAAGTSWRYASAFLSVRFALR